MDLTEIIVLSSLLVAMSVYLGYSVQRISHFLRPKDLITIALGCALISCAFVNWKYYSLPMYWFVPIVCGYFIGYLLAPRDKPLIINYVQPDKNNNWIDYYVLYKVKDKTYIADQTNRAFVRRLLGVHHELITNRPIAAKLQMSIHVPRKRKTYLGEGIYINELEETTTHKKIWWRLKAKEIKTSVVLSDASSMDNIDFVRSAGVLKRQRRQITNLHSQLQKARTEVLDKTAERVFEYIFPTDSVLREEDLQQIPKEPAKEVPKEPAKEVA